MEGQVRKFRGFVLDEPEHRLQKDGVEVSMPPKAFEVLKFLAARPRQLVGYQEIIDAVWPDTFVEEGNLRLCVHTLRKALGNDLIETVPRRGYRFNAETTVVESNPPEPISTAVTPDAVQSAASVPGNVQRHHATRRYAIVAIVLVLFAGAAVVSAIWLTSAGTNTVDPAVAEHRIAIVPFDVIADDPAVERSLSKGIYEAAAFNLRKIRGLQVLTIARGENVTFERENNFRLGRQLGADEILQASIRSYGEELRVSFELVSVLDGAMVRNGSFVVKAKPSASTESMAALRLAREIDTAMVGIRDKRRLPPGLLDENAERDYLIAQRIPRENDLNRWSEATQLMRSVVEKVPEWALGHAKLAEALVLAHGSDGCGEARSVAMRSLELDPKTAEAYLVLGVCDQIDRKWSDAESSLKRAVELDDGLDRAHLEYGLLLDTQRRFAEGEVHLKKAMELEPFSPYYNVVLCQHYYYDRKFSEARQFCERSQTIEPDYFLAVKRLYWIYVMQGRWDEVLKLAYGEKNETEAGKDPLLRPLIDRNPRKYWEVNLKDRIANQQKRHSPVAIANYHAMLGDKQKTLDYLEEAVDTNSESAKFVNPDPIFDLVRSEPRFIELMKRLGVYTGNSQNESTRSGPTN